MRISLLAGVSFGALLVVGLIAQPARAATINITSAGVTTTPASPDTTAVPIPLSVGGDNITFNAGGGVLIVGGGGIVSSAAGDFITTTAGSSIAATGATSVLIDVTAGSTGFVLTNATGATITGSGGTANSATLRINATGAAINNSGLITDTSTGPTILLGNGASVAGSTISNLVAGATISNTGTGPAILTGAGAGAVTITSSGTISAASGLAIDNSANATASTINLLAGSTTTGGVKLGTGADVLNIAGSVTGPIDAGAAGVGTLNYTATDNNSGAGNVIGGVTALGAVNFNAGTFTLGNNIRATNSTIAVGATLANSGARTITGNLIDTGTLALGTNVLTLATGAFTTGAGTGTLTTSFSRAGAYGYVDNSGGSAGTTIAGLTVAPTWTGTTGVTSGSKFELVKGYAGAAGAPATAAAITNPLGILVTWSTGKTLAAGLDAHGAVINAGDLILTEAERSAASIAGVAANNAPSIDALGRYAGADPNLGALQLAAQRLTTGAQVDQAGAQLRPNINGANQQIAQNALGGMLTSIGTQFDGMRTAEADGQTSRAAGDAPYQRGLWGEAFGGESNQGTIAGVDGYRAHDLGLAVGGDGAVTSNFRLGVAVGYAKTDANDSGTRSGSGETASSYIASVYGTYQAAPWYLDGTLSYARHNFDSTRVISFFGAPGQTASGRFTGNQYEAKLTAGYPMPAGGAVMTPLVSLDSSHLRTSAYGETGAPGANLNVGVTTYDPLTAGLGIKIAAAAPMAGSLTLRPSAHAIWYHDFTRNAPDQTATYADVGGTSFTAPGLKLGQNNLDLGVGVDLAGSGPVVLTAQYDVDLRQSYTSQGGELKARINF